MYAFGISGKEVSLVQKLLRRGAGDGGRRERRQGSHDRAHRRQGSHTRAHLAAGSHDVIPSRSMAYDTPTLWVTGLWHRDDLKSVGGGIMLGLGARSNGFGTPPPPPPQEKKLGSGNLAEKVGVSIGTFRKVVGGGGGYRVTGASSIDIIGNSLHKILSVVLECTMHAHLCSWHCVFVIRHIYTVQAQGKCILSASPAPYGHRTRPTTESYDRCWLIDN